MMSRCIKHLIWNGFLVFPEEEAEDAFMMHGGKVVGRIAEKVLRVNVK